MFEPRDETLGRYRLVATLGQGGMAELFVARLVGSGRFEKLVAIKRMLPRHAHDRRFVTMFETEARIAARLSHPNICATHELDTATDGTPFLVMELLRGIAYAELVPIPASDDVVRARFIAGVFVQVCEGLHYAHNLVDVDGQVRPIIHRDVSPTNVFVTIDGVVKLFDFGVSKDLADPEVTRAGLVKGKLPYMSPEQVRAQPLDARTDVFSLGVMLWESLAGRRLYARATDLDTVTAVVDEPPPAIAGGPAIQALARVAFAMLAKQRDDRPGARETARLIAEALAPYGGPMLASHLAESVALWLAPSLSRASRDLASAISQVREDEADSAPTKPVVPAPKRAAPTLEPTDAASDPDAFPALAAQRASEGPSSVDETTVRPSPMAPPPVAAPRPSGIRLRDAGVLVTSARPSAPPSAPPPEEAEATVDVAPMPLSQPPRSRMPMIVVIIFLASLLVGIIAAIASR